MTITNYRLRSMPHAQCHVEFYTDDIFIKEVRLVSYTTTILSVKYQDSNAVVEVVHPVDCSRTTARHVNRFTMELFGSNKYFDLKKLGVGSTMLFEGGAACIRNLHAGYLYYGKPFHY